MLVWESVATGEAASKGDEEWHDRVGVGVGRTFVSRVALACCDAAIGTIIWAEGSEGG